MTCERILMIRAGAVGDFVLSLPLLAALRSAHRGATIEILGYPWIAELAVGRRLADAVSRVDAPDLAPLFSRSGELSPENRERFSRFDLVVCVWPDRDRTIEGNLRAAGVRRLVMIDPFSPAGSGTHATDHMAAQLGRAGLEVRHVRPQVFPSERDRWWAERFMRVTGAGFVPLLGVHPGSGSARKNWPAEGFVDVAGVWMAEKGGGVLLVEGPADEEPVRRVAAALPDGRFWVLREGSLPRVAAVLERCEAYAGNDSGITHLAAAVGTPTVAVFGPTDPAAWAPRGPRTSVVVPRPGEAFPPVTAVVEALRQVVG